MNTVDALKDLYKTLSGSEWPYDPNPTDAEVIAKIAKDASGSGESGGGDGYSPRIIDIRSLSPNATMNYEPGLEMADFVGAWLLISEGGSDAMIVVNLVGEQDSSVIMMASIAGQSMVTLVYSPEGQIAML